MATASVAAQGMEAATITTASGEGLATPTPATHLAPPATVVEEEAAPAAPLERARPVETTSAKATATAATTTVTVDATASALAAHPTRGRSAAP